MDKLLAIMPLLYPMFDGLLCREPSTEYIHSALREKK